MKKIVNYLFYKNNYYSIKYYYLGLNRAIGLMSRVFAHGPRDQSSIPGRVIPQHSKMVLGAALLNTHHYHIYQPLRSGRI